MAEALQQGTYIRIKRRLDEAPLDELFISSKKRCFGLESSKNSCTDVDVCKRVDSVPAGYDFFTYVKDVLSKRSNTLPSLKLNYKKGFKNSIRENMRNEVKSSSIEKRYTLTACRRRMVDEDELQFKVFEAEEEDCLVTKQLAAMKLSQEVMSGSVKLDTSPLKNDHKDDRAITCNGITPETKIDECCYDVFYTQVTPDLIDFLGNVQSACTSYSHEKNEDSDASYDSNTESCERNNYPDDSEVSSESADDEDRNIRLKRLGIIDASSDSDDSDTERSRRPRESNRLFQFVRRNEWIP